VKPDSEHDVSDSMDKTHAPIITSLSCLPEYDRLVLTYKRWMCEG